MQTSKPVPWRILEQEIISILKDEGVPLVYDNGDTFVNLAGDGGIVVRVGDFAQELAQRLRNLR